MINIYLDKHQSALKYLKDAKVNICNVPIMTGDFNIKDSDWDLSYPHYSINSNILTDIADSFKLRLSIPVQQNMQKIQMTPIWLLISYFFVQTQARLINTLFYLNPDTSLIMLF